MRIFSSDDFAVFDLPGFEERMSAIVENVRPKLETIGVTLTPVVSAIIDRPLYAHVARHARRTVNPPDDTWVAFSADKRGYKKDVHFKVAISRHCVRLLFEAGPEYYDKGEWVREWMGHRRGIAKKLHGVPDLAWFANEHDDEPSALLADMDDREFAALGKELTRRKDGQFVVGRRLVIRDGALAGPKQFREAVKGTFGRLGVLFDLNVARAGVAS
jgi:uncharacterized protein YktB (UPF0637 family)